MLEDPKLVPVYRAAWRREFAFVSTARYAFSVEFQHRAFTSRFRLDVVIWILLDTSGPSAKFRKSYL